MLAGLPFAFADAPAVVDVETDVDTDQSAVWDLDGPQHRQDKKPCTCKISLATAGYLGPPAGNVGGTWAFRTRVGCGGANDTTVHALCAAGAIPIAQGGVHVFNTLLIDAIIGKKGMLVPVKLGADARECDGPPPIPAPHDNGSADVAFGPYKCRGVIFEVEKVKVPVVEFGGEDSPRGTKAQMELTFEILIDP